jgi:molybdate transport system substrate-binding protein
MVVEVSEQLRAAVKGAAAGLLHRIVASEPDSDCIHLSAAISLQDVVGQILTEFALLQPAVKVRAVFGASNELADHLLAGAPGDLFIAGESVHLDRLQAAGKIAPRQRRRIAANGLAIIALADTDFSVERPHDLLADRIRRLAVADPAAPLGHSTLDYLVAQRLHDSLRAKYVVVDHARAVVTAVASGAADAGVCFSSDAARTPDCRTLFSIPASQAGVQYEAAVIGGGRQPSAAKSLLTFLSSPPATRILRRNGFRPRSKAQ